MGEEGGGGGGGGCTLELLPMEFAELDEARRVADLAARASWRAKEKSRARKRAKLDGGGGGGGGTGGGDASADGGEGAAANGDGGDAVSPPLGDDETFLFFVFQLHSARSHLPSPLPCCSVPFAFLTEKNKPVDSPPTSDDRRDRAADRKVDDRGDGVLRSPDTEVHRRTPAPARGHKA